MGPIPWFKIDDGFWSHPKILELSDEAVALWVRAGSYCAGHLTDGTVKKSTLRVLGADRDAATELVLAGLWDLADDVWLFHDWDDYQPTREEVLAERAAATERKRRSREKSRAESRVTHNVTDGVSHSPPTRPDPTPSSSTKKREPAARGTRLNPDWLPSKESVNQMALEAPDVDTRTEHKVFVDYWIAQPGQKGVKTNWESTWKNWMRRKQGDVKSPTPKLSKAAQNAAEYRRLFPNGPEREFPALDAGVSP